MTAAELMERSERAIIAGILQRLAIVAGAAAYSWLNIYLYRSRLTFMYSYMGAVDLNPASWAMAGAFGIAVAPALFLPSRLDRPSVLVQWAFYVMTYVPVAFMPLLVLAKPSGEILAFNLFLLGAFLLLHLVLRIPRVRIPALGLNGWPIVVAVAVVCYAAMIFTFGANLRFISILDVYTVRAFFSQTSERAGRFASYFLFWVSNVINPLFLIQGLVTRSAILLLVGLWGQYLVYSIAAFKATLFSSAIIIALYFILQHRRRYFALRVIWAAVAGVLLLSLSEFLTALFVFRNIDTGLSTAWYWEFFSYYPKAHLRDSFLSFLGGFPYFTDVPHLIGLVYLNQPVNANANLWADAYANYGYPGIFGWTVAWGAVLWLYDSVAIGRNKILTTLLLVIPSVAFANVALHTTLATHGFALLTVLVYLMPTERTVRSRPVAPGMFRQLFAARFVPRVRSGGVA